MQPEIIQRIVIGRRMLLGFGGNLTRESDALSVAQAILLAHDAAELVLSAVATHVDAERNEKTTFMEYIGAITKKTGKSVPGKQFFETLNRQRISFKHHGILPNAEEFHRVVARSYEHLDQGCRDFLGTSLDDVDETGLLSNPSARELYLKARGLRDQGNFRRSLETLAFAIEEAVKGTPLRFSVSAGETDAAVALELTAYGVDPGAYLRLQEFLPKCDLEGKVHWERRKKGHPANWTDRNVSFCLDTALDLLLKVQNAPFRPNAADFSMAFDDVLIAKRDGALVHIEPYYLLTGWRGPSEFFAELAKGQRIKGRLTPAYCGPDPGERWNEVQSVDLADVFVIHNAKTDLSKPVPQHHVVVVQAGDFDLSDEPSAAATEFFPHLFEDGTE